MGGGDSDRVTRVESLVFDSLERVTEKRWGVQR